MAEVKWDVTLSVTETNNIGEIKPRQNNENSEVIRVALTRNGLAYDLTALKVYFVTHFNAQDNLKNPIQKEAKVIDAKNGIFEFVFDNDCMQKAGKQEAYFEVYDYDKFLDASQRFIYNIQSSSRKVIGDFTPYIETWEEAEKMLDEGTAKVLNDKTEKLELNKAPLKETEQRFEQFDQIKADKQYIESKLEATMSLNPKVIKNLAELRNNYPNGDSSIYLSSENGHWYYWDSKVNDWVDGGVYKTNSISDFPATNIVVNGDFSNKTNFWYPVGGSITIANNLCSYKVENLNQANRIEQNIDIAIPGHKYFVKGDIHPLYSKEAYFRIGDSTDFKKVMTKPNEKNVITDIVTATNTSRLRFYHYFGTDYKIGDVVKFGYVLAWDLTSTFGAGNEPKNVKEAEMYLSDYLNMFFDGTKAPLVSNKDISTDINLLNIRNGISNASEKIETDYLGRIQKIVYSIGEKEILITSFEYTESLLTKVIEKDTKQTVISQLIYDTSNNVREMKKEILKGGL